jgi:hypothetical protein
MFRWPQGPYLLCHTFGHLDKLRRLRRSNPRKVKPSRLNPHVFEKILQQSKFSSGIVITFQVMALPGMSPRNPYPVRPVSQCVQDEFGTRSPCTGKPDDAHIGRVLHPGHANQIGSTITAPITQKGNDFRFPVTHVVWACFAVNGQRRACFVHCSSLAREVRRPLFNFQRTADGESGDHLHPYRPCHLMPPGKDSSMEPSSPTKGRRFCLTAVLPSLRLSPRTKHGVSNKQSTF